MRVPAETIHRQISEVLHAWGMPDGVVRTAAVVMSVSVLAGIVSHGISMLMLYEEALGLDRVDPELQDPAPLDDLRRDEPLAQGIVRGVGSVRVAHAGTARDAITGPDIEKALDRDTFLEAEEALKFGIVDKVFAHRPKDEETGVESGTASPSA